MHENQLNPLPNITNNSFKKKKKIYDTLCVGTRDPDSKFGPLAFDTAVYCRALP